MDARRSIGYIGVMNRSALHRLASEWVALIAILAFVLGPLSLAVSRGLSAEERVLVAAGLAPLPLCKPGDGIDDLNAKTGGGACDHCTLSDGWQPVPPAVFEMAVAYSTARFAPVTPRGSPTTLSLPPSTGPPRV
jgi:hypothetical protein